MTVPPIYAGIGECFMDSYCWVYSALYKLYTYIHIYTHIYAVQLSNMAMGLQMGIQLVKSSKYIANFPTICDCQRVYTYIYMGICLMGNYIYI